MGLLKRYGKIRKAEKEKKEAPAPDVDLSELDGFDDAGDALEAEIAAELEERTEPKRSR